jgi:hypothetical protein
MSWIFGQAAATAAVQPKETAIDTSASQDIDSVLSKLEEDAKLATQRRCLLGIALSVAVFDCSVCRLFRDVSRRRC